MKSSYPAKYLFFTSDPFPFRGFQLLFDSHDATHPTREQCEPCSARLEEEEKTPAGLESAGHALDEVALGCAYTTYALPKPGEVLLLEDEEVIQAFSPHASWEA